MFISICVQMPACLLCLAPSHAPAIQRLHMAVLHAPQGACHCTAPLPCLAPHTMTFAINHLFRLFLNQNLQLRPSLTACVKVCEWAQAGVMISITPHGPWFAGACAVCSASSTALSIRSQHHEHSADAHVCMQMFRCRLGRRKKPHALPSSLTCRCVVALVVCGAYGGVWGIRWFVGHVALVHVTRMP